MMRKQTSWIMTLGVILVVAGTLSGPAMSQDEGNVPEARKVVDQYIDALGGEEAIRAHTATVAKGTMEVPSQGLSAELNIITMAPNKMKLEVTVPGMGVVQSGFDGEIGWAMNPMTGPVLQDGKELAQTKRQADFYSDLHGENLYKSMTNTGQVDFKGNPCWKLELITQEDETIIEYFNVETGLIDGMTMTQESPMGPVTITSVTGDYKVFDGVKVPTRTTVSIGPGMEQSLVINSISFEGVTEADFEPPAEIKALAGGGKAETKAPAAPEVPQAPTELKKGE